MILLSKNKLTMVLFLVISLVGRGYSQTSCIVYNIPELKSANITTQSSDITEHKIIRVNIHFILKSDGTGNFTETTDLYNVTNSHTGYWFADKIIEQCNYWLNNNQEMTQQLSCCPIEVLDINYNYKLAGVFFDKNDNYFNNQGIHSGLIQNGTNVINILVYPNWIGYNAAVEEGNICFMGRAKDAYDNFLEYGDWGIYSYISLSLNHEIGHCLSLEHCKRESNGDTCTTDSPACLDDCDDTPSYQELINDGYTDPYIWNGPGYSNNIMDYSPLETAFTPCQIERVHNYIDSSKLYFKYGVFEFSTASINNFTDNTTYIASKVSIPSGASITIQNGKRLYIDSEEFEILGAFEVPIGSTFEFTPYGL
ncbi:MAG TPA: M43 family zinc metalloprotease [Sunxiuqinia sp.]|nr:M43 family zinc metalloprotease [Sunxiuqinia sp.]